MKKFLLTLFACLFSAFLLSANTIALTETEISTVHVSAPCRIIYRVADTTMVRVSDTFKEEGLYYVLTDSVLYIKRTYFHDDLRNRTSEELPTICILNKNKLPKIKASNSFVITSKKNQKNNNETDSISKK